VSLTQQTCLPCWLLIERTRRHISSKTRIISYAGTPRTSRRRFCFFFTPPAPHLPLPLHCPHISTLDFLVSFLPPAEYPEFLPLSRPDQAARASPHSSRSHGAGQDPCMPLCANSMPGDARRRRRRRPSRGLPDTPAHLRQPSLRRNTRNSTTCRGRHCHDLRVSRNPLAVMGYTSGSHRKPNRPTSSPIPHTTYILLAADDLVARRFPHPLFGIEPPIPVPTRCSTFFSFTAIRCSSR